jgi:hypothetical protein
MVGIVVMISPCTVRAYLFFNLLMLDSGDYCADRTPMLVSFF